MDRRIFNQFQVVFDSTWPEDSNLELPWFIARCIDLDFLNEIGPFRNEGTRITFQPHSFGMNPFFKGGQSHVRNPVQTGLCSWWLQKTFYTFQLSCLSEEACENLSLLYKAFKYRLVRMWMFVKMNFKVTSLRLDVHFAFFFNNNVILHMLHQFELFWYKLGSSFINTRFIIPDY